MERGGGKTSETKEKKEKTEHQKAGLPVSVVFPFFREPLIHENCALKCGLALLWNVFRV